ncbi:plastid division protein PDV1 isoform X2 [Phalaenopsis equestris]|uniref:plastid division protein PDV1 isoform X2 n=1 Tax=Phalaenopsis equestris TaxID=78828 RepID=UPI0009E58F07|nr:plastid division protein PDV1 isoform X2 [Phalaenopsis equestris]
MKWEMEMEQIEAVLERIWDIHDKISDAIHAISRAHFLKSIKNLSRPSLEKKRLPNEEVGDGCDERRCGYVFVKGFRADEDAALAEARSLNAIRSALENLEDQIEVFHTIQSQQQAERDAAIARLEQSRIILAMRLSEHQGEKHKFIEEAQAFLSDVQEASQFIAPENLFVEPKTQPSEVAGTEKESKPHTFMQMLISSLALAKSSLNLDKFSGVLGNAALFAVSMLALLQMQQAALKHDAPASSIRSSYRSKSERTAAKFCFSDSMLKELLVMSSSD